MMDQAYSKVKAAILSFYIFFMFGAVGPTTQSFKTSKYYF